MSIPVERILDIAPNTARDAAVAGQIDLPRSVTILDNARYPDLSFSVFWLKVEVTTDIARATMRFGAGIRDKKKACLFKESSMVWFVARADRIGHESGQCARKHADR